MLKRYLIRSLSTNKVILNAFCLYHYIGEIVEINGEKFEVIYFLNESLKVLNKKLINILLENGYILRYATIYGKVYIQDNDWNIIGAVRFETYLQIVKGLKKIKGTYADDMYIKG